MIDTVMMMQVVADRARPSCIFDLHPPHLLFCSCFRITARILGLSQPLPASSSSRAPASRRRCRPIRCVRLPRNLFRPRLRHRARPLPAPPERAWRELAFPRRLWFARDDLRPLFAPQAGPRSRRGTSAICVVRCRDASGSRSAAPLPQQYPASHWPTRLERRLAARVAGARCRWHPRPRLPAALLHPARFSQPHHPLSRSRARHGPGTRSRVSALHAGQQHLRRRRPSSAPAPPSTRSIPAAPSMPS